ncbi:cation:proton antiporter subunit C [Hyphobacterium sp.]|jgi:multicomponent Na+:H+ antiporter subunit C|uniref:cation:proton antiporter subunit C n=1 Tax=Hyphobacterium sp. TaxID=2004662 RepID=UPI003BA966AF
MIEIIAERFNFIVVIILMMTGLYAVVATGNLVKRLVGLSLFQTSVFLLYITTSKVFGGQPPILPYPLEYGDGHGGEGYGEEGYAAATSHAADPVPEALAEPVPDDIEPVADAVSYSAEVIYSNPLPHVLILTAIVVGVATLSVGLALVVRIRETYGSIEDDAINKADYAVDSAGGKS